MITRNGHVEQVWCVKYTYHNFEHYLFIRGTEPELHNYLDSEMSYTGAYRALSSAEINAVTDLGMKIYIAPKE